MTRSLGREAAEAIAIAALGHIAGDDEHLSRFVALTGLEPDGLRQAAARPGFFQAVMDFVMQDDAMVMAVARAAEVRPEAVAEAARALGVVPWERDHA